MAKPRVPDRNREILRRWLKNAVRFSGMPASRLAVKAGVSQPHVTRFLNDRVGHLSLSDATVAKLASAVGIDLPEYPAPEAPPPAALFSESEFKNLTQEAVRLAYRALHDEAWRVYRDNPQRFREYAEAFLPRHVTMALDCLIDLQKRDLLDTSAIEAVTVSFKQMIAERLKEWWEVNPARIPNIIQ